jgi:hypothetical protein
MAAKVTPLMVGLGLLVLGSLVVVLGVALVFVPAGLILAGILVAAFGALVLRGSGRPEVPR